MAECLFKNRVTGISYSWHSIMAESYPRTEFMSHIFMELEFTNSMYIAFLIEEIKNFNNYMDSLCYKIIWFHNRIYINGLYIVFLYHLCLNFVIWVPHWKGHIIPFHYAANFFLHFFVFCVEINISKAIKFNGVISLKLWCLLLINSRFFAIRSHG